MAEKSNIGKGGKSMKCPRCKKPFKLEKGLQFHTSINDCKRSPNQKGIMTSILNTHCIGKAVKPAWRDKTR